MSKDNFVGWKSAWHIYPCKSFLKSLFKPIILELLCSFVLTFSTKSYSELILDLCSFVNGGYPSIVGFVLSGYALLIGFSNSELVQKMSKKMEGCNFSVFQEINATFAMMLLFLITTLLMSFLISVVANSEIDTWDIPTLCIDITNGVAFFIFLFFILYSLFSLLDVVMNIFNFGQYAYVVNVNKMEEQQDKIENSNTLKDKLLRLWQCIIGVFKDFTTCSEREK